MTIGPLAYMDPGTGSLFLQLLLGGVAGLLVFLKLFWHRITSFFGFSRKQQDSSSGEPEKQDLPSESTH